MDLVRRLNSGLHASLNHYAPETSCGSSVSIVTRPRDIRPGFDSRKGLGFISSSLTRPDRLWGPPTLLSSEYRRLFPWIKRPGREANHSSTNARLMRGAISSLLQYVFMLWCLIKQWIYFHVVVLIYA
jgi:hypothetical protein